MIILQINTRTLQDYLVLSFDLKLTVIRARVMNRVAALNHENMRSAHRA